MASKPVCLVCLRNFRQETQKSRERDHNELKLLHRLLYFGERYLRLGRQITAPFLYTTEQSLDSDSDDESAKSEKPFLFCKNCVGVVTSVCQLYQELSEVQLNLAWKVGQLRMLLLTRETPRPKKFTSAKFRDSLNAKLASHFAFGSAEPEDVENLRKALIQQCETVQVENKRRGGDSLQVPVYDPHAPKPSNQVVAATPSSVPVPAGNVSLEMSTVTALTGPRSPTDSVHLDDDFHSAGDEYPDFPEDETENESIVIVNSFGGLVDAEGSVEILEVPVLPPPVLPETNEENTVGDGINDNVVVIEQQDIKLLGDSEDCEPCELCGRTFESGSCLLRHLFKVHEDSHAARKEEGGKPFQCYACPRSFHYQQTLQLHLQMGPHESNRQLLLCCDSQKHGQDLQIFSSMSELHEHFTNEHSEEAVFKCELCNLPFCNQDSKQVHELHHIRTVNNKYPCPECGECFSAFYIIINHYKTEHTSMDDQQIYHNCPYCGKLFRHMRNFREHVEIHEKEEQDPGSSSKNVTCDVCDKTFPNEGRMKKHRKCHLRLQCPDCPLESEQTFSPDLLLRHRKRVHDATNKKSGEQSPAKKKRKK